MRKTIFNFSKETLLVLFLIFSSLVRLEAFELDSPKEYAYMDQLAVQAGADKGSFYHNYTKVYSTYFKELRDKPIRFLEIGIYKGSSVKLWENYFSQAELNFIDINFDAIEYHSTRSHYHNVNQEDLAALQTFAQSVDGPFDVVIDDGGHTMAQQIISFLGLFPYVKSGGMYIVEDLHTSYWKDFDGGGSPDSPYAGPNTMIQFLKDRIDSVNAVGARTSRADFDQVSPELMEKLHFWEKEIRSMHFYDSVCIIFRR